MERRAIAAPMQLQISDDWLLRGHNRNGSRSAVVDDGGVGAADVGAVNGVHRRSLSLVDDDDAGALGLCADRRARNQIEREKKRVKKSEKRSSSKYNHKNLTGFVSQSDCGHLVDGVGVDDGRAPSLFSLHDNHDDDAAAEDGALERNPNPINNVRCCNCDCNAAAAAIITAINTALFAPKNLNYFSVCLCCSGCCCCYYCGCGCIAIAAASASTKKYRHYSAAFRKYAAADDDDGGGDGCALFLFLFQLRWLLLLLLLMVMMMLMMATMARVARKIRRRLSNDESMIGRAKKKKDAGTKSIFFHTYFIFFGQTCLAVWLFFSLSVVVVVVVAIIAMAINNNNQQPTAVERNYLARCAHHQQHI